MQRKDFLAIASLVVATILLAGAFSVLIKPTQFEPGSGILPSFNDYNQVRSFVGSTTHQQAWNDAAESGFGSDKVAASALSSDVRHSDTNVQVEGVDEADSIKTDGHYFYVIASDSVNILNAYPAGNLSNVSKVSMTEALGLDTHYSVWINGIYLHQQKLVVIASVSGPYQSYNYSENAPLTSMIWRMPEEKTEVAIFSLVDIDHPVLLKAYGISGYPITTRMTGDCVYVLTQQCIWDRDVLLNPEVSEDGTTNAMVATKIHYDPNSSDISSFINIMAVDIEAMASNHTSVLAGYASTVYMSHSALFLTFQKTDYSGPVFMDGVASSVSSESQYSTSIYRIDIDGLSLVPAARGDVPGWLLNQFSMDEKDGYLRIATTSGWSDSHNDVYVLDSDLNVTGSLEGLALNERIYASRFIGDMLYLVTFRQVDPLFVINLTDPANPRLVGELKVPGFSAYLHPVDGNHLLGVGMIDGSVKVSLFDISDPEHPIEASNVTIPGWSYTQALYDYKAVLYDPELKLLVLPITSYDNQTWMVTSAAYLFRVNGTQVETAGVLAVPPNEYLMRALYIGEFVYTITETTVRAYQTLDMELVNELVYQERNQYFFPCMMGSGGVVAVAAVK